MRKKFVRDGLGLAGAGAYHFCNDEGKQLGVNPRTLKGGLRDAMSSHGPCVMAQPWPGNTAEHIASVWFAQKDRRISH